MPEVRVLLAHWGYAAVFLGVLLGNMGVPLPETCVLWVAGVMVWQHHFSLAGVLLIGIVAAVGGDNCGYWLGRRYGQAAVVRYGGRLGLTPARLTAARAFLLRYGPLGVFGARFITGLRFLAGPLAGSGGLAPRPFFAANLLGALVYVPLTVGEGYAMGYGLGASVLRVHRGLVSLEYALGLAAALGLLLLLGWRMRQRRRARPALPPQATPLEADIP